jgi:hypothetical protein
MNPEKVTYDITIFGIDRITNDVSEKDIKLTTSMSVDDIIDRCLKQGALGVAINREDKKAFMVDGFNRGGYLVWSEKLHDNLGFCNMWRCHGLYIGYKAECGYIDPYGKLIKCIRECIKDGTVK